MLTEYTTPDQPIQGGGGVSYLTVDHLGSTIERHNEVVENVAPQHPVILVQCSLILRDGNLIVRSGCDC